MPIDYKMDQRYALVGKTRSGKTRFAMVLAGMFAQYLYYPWQIWWIDTKGDLADLVALRQFGFRNGASNRDMNSVGARPGALYFHIEPASYDDAQSVITQAQIIFAASMQRARSERMDYNNVLVIVDEYVAVVPSTRSPGAALKDIFQRGGGMKTGIIGCTQEPVYVPRQLISQATHVFLFNLTLDYDLERIRKMFPWYIPPLQRGDEFGFWHVDVDHEMEPQYYRNQFEWFESVKIDVPVVEAAS